jgi:hypothetical protein
MSFELLARASFRVTMIEIPHCYRYTDPDFFLFLIFVLVLIFLLIVVLYSGLFFFFGKITGFCFVFFVTRTT